MALSSDEIIKREIIDSVGAVVGSYQARVFQEGSNDDQKLFSEGGLTFSHGKQDYGSCDCAYISIDADGNEIPVMAIEGTDCLSRGSSGNAQYQRFHHALGAVLNGVIGIYYLREGNHKVQPDLYGMAYNISKKFGTPYLIVQDLAVIKTILELHLTNKAKLDEYINKYQTNCYQIYLQKFNKTYSGDWNKFADKRSTILFPDHLVKYSARNIRNFTEGSQRAGHIAVGEMFLTKYSFPDKKFLYLWPRMSKAEIEYLDKNKSSDKEWSLLRNEPNVEIKSIDDLNGLPKHLKDAFNSIKMDPLKGDALAVWSDATEQLHQLIKSGKVIVV
jgi:hypothetical protein